MDPNYDVNAINKIKNWVYVYTNSKYFTKSFKYSSFVCVLVIWCRGRGQQHSREVLCAFESIAPSFSFRRLHNGSRWVIIKLVLGAFVFAAQRHRSLIHKHTQRARETTLIGIKSSSRDKTGLSLSLLFVPPPARSDESHFDMQIQPCAAYALLFIWLPIDLE